MVKKLLFTAAIAAVASTAFPQGKAVRVGAQPNKADQKSVYYLKPAGLPFEATPKNGQMFGTSYLYTPGNYEVKFVPVAAPGTQTFWHQNVYDMTGNCNSFDRTGKQGRFYSTDNDGNFYVTCRFNGADALPTLVCAKDSFVLSEENYHWGPLDQDLPAVMYWYPRMKSGTQNENESFERALQFTDDKVNAYSLGGMDNGYLFGSGTVSSGAYTVCGVQQVLEKPAAPLWITDVFLPAISKSDNPLPEGTELTLMITNVETTAEGRKKPGSEVLAEMKCTASNLEAQEDVEDEDGNVFHQWAAVFPIEEGGMLIDEEFAVVVRGLDQEGVDLGLKGAEIPYYNDVLDPALCIISADGKETTANIYGNNRIAMSVSFTGKFDFANGFVDISETDSLDYGLVQMDKDGKHGVTTASPDQTFEGAVAQVNGSWYGDNKKEEYTLSGLADWVKGYTVDQEGYSYAGLTVISFTCDPLPADCEGRSCTVLIHGKGVVSTRPITIVQGDATAAVNSAKVEKKNADAPMYNMAGQRVNKDYKGVVIQNGTKHINK